MAKSNVHPHPAAGTTIPPGADPDAAMDNEEVRGAIDSTFKRVRTLEDERAEVNSSIRACWEGLKSRGLNIRAVRAQYAYWKMDDTAKHVFDLTMSIARKAIGRPVQIELIEPEDEDGQAAD